MMTSSGVIMPRSPWLASPGCTKIGRRAGRREGRGDLAADMAGLAHAGDDHPALRGADQVDRRDDRCAEPAADRREQGPKYRSLPYRACAAPMRSAGSRGLPVFRRFAYRCHSGTLRAGTAQGPSTETPRRTPPQRDVNHAGFTSINHKPRRARPRGRVTCGVECPALLARAGAGAAVLALAATHASAQSSKPPVNGLRPAFEDADDEPDNSHAPRIAPRSPNHHAGRHAGRRNAADLRQSGEQPDPELGQSRRIGRRPHRLYVSTNTKRRPQRHRADHRARRARSRQRRCRPRVSRACRPAGHHLDDRPAGDRREDQSGRTAERAPPRRRADRRPPPRAKLVRIPDGTATGGIAGTVNTAVLQPNYATLLRRRVTTEDDPYAQLGLRRRRIYRAPGCRGDRRIRHQSGARSERQSLVLRHGCAGGAGEVGLDAP